jgi:membrane glycosyltransferase
VEAWKSADPDRERIVYRRRADNAPASRPTARFLRPLGQGCLMLRSCRQPDVGLSRAPRAHDAGLPIGILQSLVVGMPSASAFARIFQFGMRHGSAPTPWAGLVGGRLRSFTGPMRWCASAVPRQCDLPMLPGKPPLGGQSSADQVEATLMRPPAGAGPPWARQLGPALCWSSPAATCAVPGQHAVPEAP